MVRLPGDRVGWRDRRVHGGAGLVFRTSAGEMFRRGGGGGLVEVTCGAPEPAEAPLIGRAGAAALCNGLRASAAAMFPASGYGAGARHVGGFLGRTLAGGDQVKAAETGSGHAGGSRTAAARWPAVRASLR